MLRWDDLTADDYMKIEYIARVYHDQAYLAGLYEAMLGIEAEVAHIDTSKGIYTAAYAALMNGVERNIDRLTAIYRPSAMQATRTWRGERGDAEAFKFSDVNRWFDSLMQIESMLGGMEKRIRITGNYSCGENAVRQLVRAV